MPIMSQPYFNELHSIGLNLQAVFSIRKLPVEVQSILKKSRQYSAHYNQLVLLGHGGKTLWTEAKSWQVSQKEQTENLIDDFSSFKTIEYLSQNYSSDDFELIWPYGDSPSYSAKEQSWIDLQALGTLAGWHNDSPFQVGINREWGTWFAYRAVVLMKSDIEVVKIKATSSPCVDCVDKPCLSACPANLQNNSEIKLVDCIKYRTKSKSHCKNKCLARLACPVRREHQYDSEQIDYHYSLSLKIIEKLKGKHSYI